MIIKKCDWCGKTEEQIMIRSRLTICYGCEVNQADDDERPWFKKKRIDTTWDLCDECGRRLYELIEKRPHPEKIL